MTSRLEVYEGLAVDLAALMARATPRGLRPIVPQPQNTQSWFVNQWGDVTLPAVTDETTLGLAAAWRSVNMIAGGVAAMAPPRVLAEDETTELERRPIAWRPSSLYSSTEFWSMAVAHCLTSGNFVGILADFSPDDGWPRQVIPVHTRNVSGYFDVSTGLPVYEVGGVKLSWADVVHVRWLPQPGQVMGIGVVDAFRRALGGALDQQNYAAATYRTGAIPSGIIKVHLPQADKTQTDAIKEQWVDAIGGGQRAPAVLPELFDFTPIAWSPEDVQFLEARKFSVGEVAMMFGLDPSDLGATFGAAGQLTYANLSQRLAARVVETYGPWLARFEEAWSDLVPGGNVVRFRRERYTHASRRELFEEQQIGITAGVLTKDEARAELNRPPLPEPTPPPALPAPDPASVRLPAPGGPAGGPPDDQEDDGE